MVRGDGNMVSRWGVLDNAGKRGEGRDGSGREISRHPCTVNNDFPKMGIWKTAESRGRKIVTSTEER